MFSPTRAALLASCQQVDWQLRSPYGEWRGQRGDREGTPGPETRWSIFEAKEGFVAIPDPWQSHVTQGWFLFAPWEGRVELVQCWHGSQHVEWQKALEAHCQITCYLEV